MASNTPGTLVVILPYGEGEVRTQMQDKPVYEEWRKAVGGPIQAIKIRYKDNKVYTCYVHEEGILQQLGGNPKLKEYAEAYYKQSCQDFFGPGAFFIKDTDHAK